MRTPRVRKRTPPGCLEFLYILLLLRIQPLDPMSRLIFFVDDDKMILNLLEYTFQSRKDYEVVSFLSGEECLQNMDRAPAAVVLDHVMAGPGRPGLSGLETLREIRKDNLDVPVIILTGQGDDELLGEFMESGASRYLTKDDFFIDSLMEIFEQLLP